MRSLLSCRDSWRQKAERCEATLAAATQRVAALQAGVATEDAGAAPGEDDDQPQDVQDALLEQLGRAQGQVTCSVRHRQSAEPWCCSSWLAFAVVDLTSAKCRSTTERGDSTAAPQEALLCEC